MIHPTTTFESRAGSAPSSVTRAISATGHPDDEIDQEGLSWRQIRWIPVAVPLFALTLLLGATAVLNRT